MSSIDSASDSYNRVRVRARRRRSSSPARRESYRAGSRSRSPVRRERSRPATNAGFYEDWEEDDPASTYYWARPRRSRRRSPPQSVADPEDRLYNEYVRSAEERLRAAISADPAYGGSAPRYVREYVDNGPPPLRRRYGSRPSFSPERARRREWDDADRFSSTSRRDAGEVRSRSESVRRPFAPANFNLADSDEYSGGVYTAGSSSVSSDGESGEDSGRVSRDSGSRSRSHERAGKPKSDPPTKASKKPPRAVPSEWREPKWILPDSSITELLSIHSAEFQIDKSGKERVVLVCPNRPQTQEEQGGEDGSRVQMKWLHVQHPNPELDVLSKLVLDCPLISVALQKQALGVLDDLSQAKSGYKDFGVVTPNDNPSNTGNERVLFLSMLHLKLSPTTNRSKGARGDLKSLLEFFYSDDIDPDREGKQVIRKMNVGSPSDSLHVATLWCLLLGSNLLITFSPMPRSEVCGDLIEIDSRSARGFYTVPVEYRPGLRHNIVIEPDCSYVDFLRQAVALCTAGNPDAREYELILSEENDQVTASRWLQLLSSETVEKETLRLIPVDNLSPSRMSFYGSARERSHSRAASKSMRSRNTSRRSSVRPPGVPPFSANPFSPSMYGDSAYSEMNSRRPVVIEVERRYRDMSPQRPPHSPLPRRRGGLRHVSPPPTWTSAPYYEEYNRPTGVQVSQVEKISYEYVPRRPSGRSTGQSTYFSSSTYVDTTPVYWYGRWPHERLLESPRHSQSSGSKSEEQVEDSTRLEAHGSSGSMPVSRQGPLFARYPMPTPQMDYDGIRVYPLPSPGDAQILQRGQTRHVGEADNSSQENGYSVRERHRVRIQSRFASDSSRDSSPRRYRRRPSPSPLPSPPPPPIRRRPSPSPSPSPPPIRRLPSSSSSPSLSPPPPPIRRSPERDSNSSSDSGPHRRVRFNQHDSVRERSASPVAGEPEYHSLETMGITTIPFFTWRLKSSKERLTPEETDTALFRILGKIHKSLQRDKSVRFYDKTYKCTMEGVLRRYSEVMIQESPASVSGSAADGAENNIATAPNFGSSTASVDQSISTIADIRGSLSSSVGSMKQKGKLSISALASSFGDEIFGAFLKPSTSASTSPGAPTDRDPTLSDHNATGGGKTHTATQESRLTTSGDTLTEHHEPLKRFIEQSQALLWAFLPKEGSSQIHQVCARFWGAIDEIIRHFLWSASHNVPHQKWVVGNLSNPPPAAEKTKFEDCASCKARKTYLTASEALDHLHSEHIDCSHARRTIRRPSDDPCFAWLRQMTIWKLQQPLLLRALEQFVEHVVEFCRATNEVHSLLATYQPPEEGRVQRPLLPSRLVHAFEEIVIAYILTAQEFSAVSRYHEALDMIKQRTYSARLNELGRQTRSSIDNAHELLEWAKKDIILAGSGSREIDSLGLYVIRPEFLVAALTTVVQDRPLDDGSKTAVVDLYGKYTSKLRYQANRRPQRRVFLDVHNLEEELEAIREIVRVQRDRVAWYLDSIKPRLSLLEEDPRHEFYRIEERYGRKQLRKLLDRADDLSRLQKRCKALKEQVKQTLEILEEDHGKAIRVFTIVTLFFLPLSFVTGFMGMNTNDIRNMENNQDLFWSVAIPVTALVMSLAFVYGYKGDSIEDWLSTALHSRRHRSLDKKKDLTLKPTTTFTSVERGLPDDEKESAIPSRSWRDYGRRKKSKSAMIRRRTNESGFS